MDMRLPIAVQFGSGLVLAILVLAAVSIEAAQSISLYNSNAALGRANRDYQQVIQSMLETVVDAESAQRGFIITGKADYLDSLRQAAAAVDPGTRRISELARQIDLHAQPKIAALAQVIQRKFSELQQVIDLSRDDHAAAVTVIGGGTGDQLMQQIRGDIDALNNESEAALQDSREKTQAAFHRLASMTTIGILASIILLAISGIFSVFSVKRRVDALVDASRRLGAGELGYRVPVSGADEVSALAKAFNQMAAQLKDSNEALDSFAYTVSHDLRAPLRAMEGFAQSLLEDYGEKLDEVGKDYAQRIVGAGRRMGELIQDLLAYSRLSRSDFRLRPEPLGDIVKEAQAAVAAETTGAAAVIVTEGEFPQIIGHRPTLRQIVINLLSNALKFVSPGAKPAIRLYGERVNDRYRLWVEDNGIGIAPEHRDRIFKIFERLHGIESYPGTGIGLAIVSKGAERMGGRAGVDANPAGGSRFWVEFAMERGTA
jgi:signal transduction histidine kinase